MDTLIYKGIFNGWPIEYRRTYTGGVNANGEPDVITRLELEGAIAFLEANGVQPAPLWAAAPAAAPASAPAAPAAPASRAAGQWVCPIHGAAKLRDSQYGRECAVTTKTEPEYPHRTWTGRQGQTMYTCAARERGRSA